VNEKFNINEAADKYYQAVAPDREIHYRYMLMLVSKHQETTAYKLSS